MTTDGQIRQCPECQGEIPVGAKRCKHCGADLRSWVATHPGYTLVLILLVLWWFWSHWQSPENNQNQSVDTTMGQQEKVLKSEAEPVSTTENVSSPVTTQETESTDSSKSAVYNKAVERASALWHTEAFTINIINGFKNSGYSQQDAEDWTLTIFQLLWIERNDPLNTDAEKAELRDSNDLVLIGEIKALMFKLKTFQDKPSFSTIGDGIVVMQSTVNKNITNGVSLRYVLQHLNAVTSTKSFAQIATLPKYLYTASQVMINSLQ